MYTLVNGALDRAFRIKICGVSIDKSKPLDRSSKSETESDLYNFLNT